MGSQTREFPEGRRSAEIDRAHLHAVIQAALRSTLSVMAQVTNVAGRLRQTTYERESESRIRTADTLRPIYSHLPDAAKRELVGEAEFKRLSDYLWEHGLYRKTFTGRPPRTTWELSILHELEQALNRALALQAATDASRGREVQEYRVCDDILAKTAAVLTDLLGFDRYRYRLACPLYFFEGAVGRWFDLTPEISIGVPTLQEAGLDLALWSHILNPISPLRSVEKRAVLTIRGTVERAELHRVDKELPPRRVARRALHRLDRTKWALASACGATPRFPVEGPAILSDDLGAGVGALGVPFRIWRDPFDDGSLSGTVFELTEDYAGRAGAALSLAERYGRESPDIATALEYWGRAAAAIDERDRLLEAVIGLDRLLVSEKDQLRFRFQVVGGALLAGPNEDTVQVAGTLKDIYDARSSGAHGNARPKEAGKAIKLAPVAHKYLTQAIGRIMELFEKGSLSPTQSAGSQLLQIVLSRLPRL